MHEKLDKFNEEVKENMHHVASDAVPLIQDVSNSMKKTTLYKKEQAAHLKTEVDDVTIPESTSWGNNQTRGADPDPDIKYTIAEIIEENGFGYSEFEVTTPDGYVLLVQRVINDKLKKNAPVVFL